MKVQKLNQSSVKTRIEYPAYNYFYGDLENIIKGLIFVLYNDSIFKWTRIKINILKASGLRDQLDHMDPNLAGHFTSQWTQVN